MAFFKLKGAQNTIFNDSSLRDGHNVHTYNSIVTTRCTPSPSLLSISGAFSDYSILTTRCTSSPRSGAFSDYSIVTTRSSPSNSGAFSDYSIVTTRSSPSRSGAFSDVWYPAEEEQCLDRNFPQRQSLTFVEETAEGSPGALENEGGGKIKEVVNAEDIVSDQGRSINRAYQFYNCQSVYMHSFNAHGVKVKNSGNNLPQVIHHGGKVVVRPSNDKMPLSTNKGGSSSSSQASNPIKYGPQYEASRGQPSQYQSVHPDLTFRSPPKIYPIPSQLRDDNSLNLPAAQPQPPSASPVGISLGSRNNNPLQNQFTTVLPANRLPAFEQGQASSYQYNLNRTPVSTTLPGPVQNAPPNGISTANKQFDKFLQPNRHPSHYSLSPLATTSWQYPPDTNSQRLEQLLDTTLETASAAAEIIQRYEVSNSPEILSPRARDTLEAIKALVSVEMLVSGPNTITSDPPTRFKSIKKMASWFRIPRSPKSNI